MNSIRSNNVSLKYQRFATLESKDIGIMNSKFVAKTQFLCGIRKNGNPLNNIGKTPNMFVIKGYHYALHPWRLSKRKFK